MTQSYFKPARLTLKIGFSGDVEGTFDGQLEMELYHQRFIQGSEDSKEGPRAFMEKRAPQFEGC